jgi:phosphonate transport system substrate-binding protein
MIIGIGGALLLSYLILDAAVTSSLSERLRPSHIIDLESPSVPPPTAVQVHEESGESLSVAIAPVVSPKKSLEMYAGLVEFLAKKTDRYPSFLQGPSYAAVNDLVRYRQCDMALICTYAYVRGEQEFGMEILAIPKIGGKTTYQSYIIVPESSSFTSLLDLRGLRFASSDFMSNSGWLYPVTWLFDHGEIYHRFFGKHEITGSHDYSILAVSQGYVDGAAVDSIIYERMTKEDPIILSRTKVIQQSQPFGMPPLVVHPEIDQALKDELYSVLVSMHLDEEGQKILAALNIDQFVAPSLEDYNDVRRAANIVDGHE